MNINTYKIKYSSPRELDMELNYQVASARVREDALFGVIIEAESMEKAESAAAKSLRGLKKRGRIQLFEFVRELSVGESVESVYLVNKYPSLAEELADTPDLILIKM